MKVIGEPVSLTHSVNGSFPICSDVDATVVVALTGKVTGTGALHVLPFADVRTAPTIEVPFPPVV